MALARTSLYYGSIGEFLGDTAILQASFKLLVVVIHESELETAELAIRVRRIDLAMDTCFQHTCTSSSLRMGILRTLCFCLRSLESGALMILRRMWDGAWKWRLLFFLREDDTNLFSFMAAPGVKKQRTSYNMYQKMMYLVQW